VASGLDAVAARRVLKTSIICSISDLSGNSHSSEVNVVDADAGGDPLAGRRGRLTSLLLGFEHDERETLAVDGLQPIAGDEAGG
jgi:hypothetical protein